MRNKLGRFMKGSIPYIKGKKHSEETKYKISLANKGKSHVGYWLGKKRSEEWKRKISLMNQGKKNHFYGKKHSLEIRELLSQLKLGSIPWNKGIPHTDNTKRKISLANKGNNNWLGRHHSEETKEKIKKARARQVIPLKDTSIEVTMQNELKESNIQFEKHKPIFGQPDLFISPNVCIFCDGDYWHSDNKQKIRDESVNTKLRSEGYIIFRYTETEINSNVEGCIDEIITNIQKVEEGEVEDESIRKNKN